jgi:hypothetical protein
MKGLLIVFVSIGTFVGSYAPTLWGDSNMLSGWSLLLGVAGGIAGLYFGWKFIQNMD